jgi:hypothetical protein
MEHGIDIARQLAGQLRRHRRAHDRERVDREIRIELEFVSLWRAMKRRISSCSYSILFLMPPNAIIGGLLLVSLNTPPSRTGTYSNFAPVRASISGITLWDR